MIQSEETNARNVEENKSNVENEVERNHETCS